MTNDQRRLVRRVPQPRSGQKPAGTAEASPERDAILAGVRAGDVALARFHDTGVLILFVEGRRSGPVTPKLEALRTYAELRRVLLSRGKDIPGTSLVAAGFTATQIARFDEVIADISSGEERKGGPPRRHMRTELTQ